MSVKRTVTRFRRRVGSAWLVVQALVLAGAGLTPFLISGSASAAGQLSLRKITAGTSKVNTSTTYAVSFQSSTTTTIKGIVVEFCQNSPLIGTACTTTNGVSGIQTSGTIAVAHGSSTNFTAGGTGGNILSLTNATGFAGVTGSDTTFSFTATTPSTSPNQGGSYYARILTFANDSGADSPATYTSASPGNHIDDGGIALAVSNQLTITARVQEVLQFCVGTTDAATNNDCSDISGTTVDIGVVDSTAVAATANSAGKAMLRTNAVNGASVVYFAEQETSSGKLKVVGATCSGTATTDQCFNSAGATATAFTADGTTEAFGMTSPSIDTSNGSTTNLTRDVNYDNATEYAWVDTGTTDEIASSTTVVDDELINLKFAAVAAATTPTGAYTVTSTFVATGTF